MKKTLLLGALNALLSISTLITPLFGQEKGICPEIAKFAIALTKHQQVQVKDMLKASGLLDATGLSKQDQENLVIEYEQKGTASGINFLYAITKPDELTLELTLKEGNPRITIADEELKDLRKIFTQEQLIQWGIKNAFTLAHEATHLVNRDPHDYNLTATEIIKAAGHLPLNNAGRSLKGPYPLYFYSHFADFVFQSVGRENDISADTKHFLVKEHLSHVQKNVVQKSPEHLSRLEKLQTAAQSYTDFYKSVQITEQFWEKSQATRHTAHTKKCLGALSDTLWPIFQQGTWFSQFNELQADKGAIETILKLPHSADNKKQMFESRKKYMVEAIKGYPEITDKLICSHPPDTIRLEMIDIGLRMLKEGQTPELTEKLDKLAIPSYLKIPKEPKRTPVERP